MKIGNFEFKDYAVQKPLTMTRAGEFLSVSDVMSQPVLSLSSTFTLEPEQKLDLAVKRYSLEPDFKLWYKPLGMLSRDDVIDEMKKKSDFGEKAVDLEMGYINELMQDLREDVVRDWPPIPRREIPPIPDWRYRKRCIWLRLTNRVLFCENTTDPVTTPFANYRMKYVHPEFTQAGFNIIVLQGSEDVRDNFVTHAKKALTIYVSGIGHGAYHLYTGHYGNHILEVGGYDQSEVKNKSFHFLSCQTGRDLGPDTVANGAKCYAGYSENFVLMWDDGTTSNVDEFELFARSDSTYDIMMANGATAQEAYDATIQAFNAAIAQAPNSAAAPWLAHDRDHFRLHGSGETQIKPTRAIKICFPLPFYVEDALVRAGKLTEMPK